MKTSTRSAVAATFLVAALALTGCVASGPTIGGTSHGSKPVASAPATPKATKAPLAGDLNSDGRIDAFERQQIERTAPRPYALSDGTTVTVDPTEPLPAPVLADIKATIATPISNAVAAGDASGQVVVDSKAAQTGRGIVVVTSSIQSGYRQWVALASGQKQGLFLAKRTEAEAVAAATDWATERDFDVIVYG